MNKKLEELVKVAKSVQMTDPQKYEQRVSFAYGTTKIENDRVTKKLVREIAMKQTGGKIK